MTKDELLARLLDHEDNFVERKSDGVSPSDIRKAASAFANTVDDRSAIVFIGIHDKTGQVVGVRDSDQMQKKVRGACMDDCYPPITYSSEVLTLEGKAVIAVVIPPSRDRPHFTGPAFIRVGSESIKANQAQYEDLVAGRIDKCREILRHKAKGLITVRGVGYKLGSKKPLHDARYVEETECQIVNCTAHTVTLFQPATGREFSESMRGVEINRDDKRLGRLMLLVHFPRP